MQDAKTTAWGTGVMGIVGLAGAVLGRSPLLLPLAPLVAIAYLPLMLATAALGTPLGLADLGLGGKVELIVWCAALGAGAGKLFGAWRARRRKRGKEAWFTLVNRHHRHRKRLSGFANDKPLLHVHST